MHIVRALNTRMQSNAMMMRLSRRRVSASSGVGARRLIFRGGARDFRGVKDAVRFIVAYSTLGNCQLFGNEYQKSRFLNEEEIPGRVDQKFGDLKTCKVLKFRG